MLSVPGMGVGALFAFSAEPKAAAAPVEVGVVMGRVNETGPAAELPDAVAA
jgi:hypothetical protein